MSHLSATQLARLRRDLTDQRTALQNRLRQNDRYGLQEPLRETTGDSSVDNHPADQGSELFERAKDFALNERTEHTLEQIDRALRRMETGDYGICEACGKPIPYERLEVLPFTPYCVDHTPNSFVSDNRPIEERLLDRPFGRTSLDERDAPGFDGEDAWQIVERWGTSNSPAFAEDPNVDDYDGEMAVESGEPDGYVEPIESFLATDLYGNEVSVVRNAAYRRYMNDGLGDRTLETGAKDDDPAVR
jgi:YteA family regulatory protein